MSKKRKDWSKDNLKTLRTSAGKIPAKKIAGILKRTEGSVRQKAMNEDISLRVKEKYRDAA